MDQLPVDFFTNAAAYTPRVYRDQYPAIDPTSPSLNQAGQIVIITGASSGIGANGIAPAFAKAKAKALVLVARNGKKLRETEQEIKKIHPATSVLVQPTDITNSDAVVALFEKIRFKYGHVDVLVNNAGTFSHPSRIVDADPAEWWNDFEVNVKGQFLVTQAFLKLLGTERKGTMISMSSAIATSLHPMMSSYSISKMALLRLNDYVAAEYPNVCAVSLQPGLVMTDMVLDSLKRFAIDTPALIGGTTVWLATDAARFLNGRFISANWSVEDLAAAKEKILEGNDLQLVYQGKFGLDQSQ
ncbi:hypothetical protein Asppvi_005397 [Aspergillus pseudoviridinutans]|uniref:Oxidoreductase n=1 Tax=Aspergillus pseudoviridinutans TaxID=1517512 RepID=A0A9P3BDV0_9EURO|nr:uncharacterized protein Asppvi_005397 [Aspergillus pseudoviridinutans]GIJ86508.1 hypothetical protein Asppvi_005397 [Aspergillus pseudoviridinutans]